MRPTIFTIGHSTHTIERFVELLWRHKIGAVADVRLHPGSQRMPHFNRDALDETLAAESIRYEHFKELGGRREPGPDTENTGWTEPAFRAYAAHMRAAESTGGPPRLDELARQRHTARLCAV